MIHKKFDQPVLHKATQLLARFHEAGFSAYIVGGAVRDALLRRVISDIDVATDALPDQTISLFEKVIPTGIQHGTVTVLFEGESYEVTTFRSEEQYVDHRHPQQVYFVKEFYTDLARRDFTMNAMGIDHEFHLYDPFQGQQDIANGILRTVGQAMDRFHEDALRMLRAIRFAITYQLQTDEQLWQALSVKSSLLTYISMERICNELTRILKEIDSSAELDLLLRSELLMHTKEGLSLGKRLAEGNSNSFSCAGYPIEVKWSLWFASNQLSIEDIETDLKKLKLSKLTQQNILTLCRMTYQVIHSSREQTIIDVAHLVLQYGYEQVHVWANHIGFEEIRQSQLDVMQLISELTIHHCKELELKGKDLLKWSTKPSGPWIKDQLDQLFVLVATGKLINNKRNLYEYWVQHFGKGEYIAENNI